MKDAICWGMIGCGDVSEYKGGPALYRAPHSRLVAVMSRQAQRAKDFARRHQVPRHYSSVDQLLADAQVQAVYIATPPDSHAQLTVLAAQAGKHVLCEKPMALDTAECQRMIDACQEQGVQLMIAYYRRFFPIVKQMKALLDQGRIGRILRARTAVASYYEPRTDGQRQWLVQPDVAGGGYLTDVATHRLDLLTHLLGRAESVSALVETQHFDFAVDDASTLLIRFAGDVHATGCFSWNVAAPLDELEVWGTAGRLLAGDLGAGQLEIFTEGERETHRLPAPTTSHLDLVAHYVECLRSDTPNDLPGQVGIEATRLTEAAYQSARTRQRIPLR